MAKTTDIQWADSTVNVAVGCDSPCEIAERCYARRLLERFAGLSSAEESTAREDHA